MNCWEPGAESALFYQVSQVLNRYARGVDRKDWALTASAFHADAHCDYGALRGTPADFIGALSANPADMPNWMHLISNVSLLEIDRDRREVLVESYCVSWQRLSASSEVIPPLFASAESVDELNSARLLAVGNRYLDLLSERETTLRISRRTVISEWHTAVSAEDRLPFTGKTGTRSADDFSYTTLELYRSMPR